MSCHAIQQGLLGFVMNRPRALSLGRNSGNSFHRPVLTGHSSLVFGRNPRISFIDEAAMEAKAGVWTQPPCIRGDEGRPLARKTTQPQRR
jgi:hypothetical protein